MSFIREHLMTYVMAIMAYLVLNAWSGFPVWMLITGSVITICLVTGILMLVENDDQDNHFNDWWAI